MYGLIRIHPPVQTVPGQKHPRSVCLQCHQSCCLTQLRFQLHLYALVRFFLLCHHRCLQTSHLDRNIVTSNSRSTKHNHPLSCTALKHISKQFTCASRSVCTDGCASKSTTRAQGSCRSMIRPMQHACTATLLVRTTDDILDCPPDTPAGVCA